MRTSAVASSLHALLLAALLGAGVVSGAGCGDDAPPPNPKAFLGTYKVTISSGGKSDSDVLNIVAGSNNTILLEFVAGVSEVRCVVIGSTALTVLSQTVHVEHSSGVQDGVASGRGTLTADGKLTMTLDVAPPTSQKADAAVTSADAGIPNPPVSSKASYAIEGTLQK